ncbi:MAG TPA: pyrimidine/purine nucleoside phosphorylase [Thiothrix sp.]|nr:pyrimidine/purine nucleoside phosphorylase [Thiothrix sp.]
MFKTNEYFDGKVISVAYQTETLPATVGVMAAGDYTFNTGDKEKMTVVSGAMTIKRKDDAEAITFSAGESFDVEANSSFEVSIASDTAYLCLYG